MPTLRTVTVKSAGGDYSSLNAAFVGEVGDLVALDRALQINCSAFVDATAAATGSGWTTDATHDVVAGAVDNHLGFYGGPGGAAAYSCAGIDSSASHVTVRGISASNPLHSAIRLFSPANRAHECIVFNGIEFNDPTAYGRNCLSIVTKSGYLAYSIFGGTVHSCTAIGGDLFGFGVSGAGTTLINCLAVGPFAFRGFGLSTGLGSFSSSCATCASTDANVPTSGSGHRASQAITLVDPAGGDYRLDASDTGAKGFGTDLSADPTNPFAIDIGGDPRPATWDIGHSNAVSVPHRGRLARRAAFGLVGML